MTDLPVPAFASAEEQLEGGKAIAEAGDTTVDNIATAVPQGKVLIDSNMVHARYLKKEGDLLYHIFRGEGVPQKFWGEGEFGLLVLDAAEVAWKNTKTLVEFHSETVRPEAVEDDPTQSSKYPPCYYGAYLVTVPAVDQRPLPPDEERFMRLAVRLEELLTEASKAWTNGS